MLVYQRVPDVTSFGDFPRRFILYMENWRSANGKLLGSQMGKMGDRFGKISCFLDTHEHTKLQSRIISYHLCHTDFIHPGLKYIINGALTVFPHKAKQWQSTCSSELPFSVLLIVGKVPCDSATISKFWSRSLFNLVHSLFTIWLFNIAMV